jgi:succinate-semialdehyde dehydrogenase / glutarate-semialdehyde dehydrogenase
MPIQSINPTKGEVIKNYHEMSVDEINQIINDVDNAQLSWRKSEFSERAKLMKNAAQILRKRNEEFAILMAQEMGKPIREGRAEAEKCAWVCDYYAENSENFLKEEVVETEASKSYVTFQPIGIVLAVMPWNFPFWQVFRFAAPALMAGNAGLLKHSSNVFGCALAIEEVFREAGFPENIFRSLLIGSKAVDAVIENPNIKAVTLTGSTPAGQAVAKKAGEMLKKSVLELGGSDPYIVLKDANLDETVTACVTSRLINAGQSCIAAKRFIVDKEIKEQFETKIVELMKSKIMGDPLLEETNVGPQARHDLRDELHKQVEKSINSGAKCLLGGTIPEGNGAFYPPTVLSEVRKGMPAYDEELFGPVAAIIPVKNEEEAIQVANDSVFGLGAAIFTQDVKRGEQLAATEIEAGSCFVNTFVKSDPRLPFGGIKESGYGRELSHFGIKEFVNIKTVYIK